MPFDATAEDSRAAVRSVSARTGAEKEAAVKTAVAAVRPPPNHNRPNIWNVEVRAPFARRLIHGGCNACGRTAGSSGCGCGGLHRRRRVRRGRALEPLRLL